jgi:DNA-binding transcriptional MerR regulator
MARSAAIQIGELSRQTGCNVETIRYYERVGLLPRPPRSAGRYRLYDTGDVRRLAFVRRARELGFTFDEVRAFLVLSAPIARTPVARCAILRLVTSRTCGRRLPISGQWGASCLRRCAGVTRASPAVR